MSIISFLVAFSHVDEDKNFETIFGIFVQNFQLQSRLLFELLSSIRGHQSGPHLTKFLLRIDYNYYYSMSGGKLGRLVKIV